jgi:hypothetical protein
MGSHYCFGSDCATISLASWKRENQLQENCPGE